MPIITNRHWRQFRYRYEVPEAVLADDYEHLDADVSDGFFKYRGCWYHTSDFLRLDESEWDGAAGVTNTSSVVIKIARDGEAYQIGLAWA